MRTRKSPVYCCRKAGDVYAIAEKCELLLCTLLLWEGAAAENVEQRITRFSQADARPRTYIFLLDWDKEEELKFS